jgi:Xaa-Pro aminopeptidase
MKSDLDALMHSENLDALLVIGSGQHNPAMVYLTGGAHLTDAVLIKKRDFEPVLFSRSMERDEAAKTGLINKNLDKYPIEEILKQTEGDHLQAYVKRYHMLFEEIGFDAGRIGIYGLGEAGASYSLFTALQETYLDITFIGEFSSSVLQTARATKDEDEIKRIRKMGQITTTVVGKVADFLTSHKVKDEVLIKSEGIRLKIADVKRRINLWLAEAGVENPKGCIFAIGRDAGVPHSSGTQDDTLQLGQTIVFDIFPCEQGGGYYFDFTRTWCLGYAKDEAHALYEDVKSVYQQILEELQIGQQCTTFQERACELFEAQGHATIRSNPQTQTGYVHSLGHGIGLNIHEHPRFGLYPGNDDLLQKGAVFTVEPGLYYPDRGLGVRLEDSVWLRPNGNIEILSEYPLDFVLPMG